METKRVYYKKLKKLKAEFGVSLRYNPEMNLDVSNIEIQSYNDYTFKQLKTIYFYSNKP
jgi:hypothetical protein